MTRDDIIRMAREAECAETWGGDSFRFTIEELESFFHLAQASEREKCVKDAERYRWLRDTIKNSVGVHLTANEHALVYEEPDPEGVVQVQWYPDTPIGFYRVCGSTLDEVIDKATGEK